MNASHPKSESVDCGGCAPPAVLTERQLDQIWIEEERERCSRLASTSRARTFAPQRCRFTRLEPVRTSAPGLALCVFALTLALIAIFLTGAAPFVKSWLLGWLA